MATNHRVLLTLTLAGTALTQTPVYSRHDLAPAPRAIGVWDPVRELVVAFEPHHGAVWEWNGQQWARRLGVAEPDLLIAEVLYDPNRERILTWGPQARAWDGARWSPTTPGLPGGWQVAFDRARNRIVAHTGFGLQEWDGTAWSTPSVTPPVAVNASIVYDPLHQRAVVYGGGSGAGACFGWDGQQAIPLAAPAGGLSYPGLIWDEVGQRVVLYDGQGPTTSTWALQDTTWTQLQTTVDPGPRLYPQMVFDGTGALLWGGYEGRGDFWRLVGDVWQRLIDAPPQLVSAGMAVHEPTQQIVLFAGKDAVYGSALLQQTWTWDGVWHRQAPTASPPARVDPLMTWSPADGAVLLFGGSAGGNVMQDTWLWNGSDWHQAVTPNAPPPRSAGALCREPGGTVMLVGAASPIDQWRWDGQQWTELTPPGIPNVIGAAAAWDPLRDVTLLMGRNPGNNFVETWSWDGANWTPLPLPTFLFPYANAPIVAFRPETGRMLFDTGFQLLEWDGVQWYGPEAIAAGTARLGVGCASLSSVLTFATSGSAPQRLALLTSTPADAESYGAGCAIQAIPALSLRGPLGPEYPAGQLLATTWAPQTLAIFTIGLTTDAIPFGHGCELLVGTPLLNAFALTDVAGDAGFAIAVPPNGTLLGLPLRCQALVHDPANSWHGGLTMSAGLTAVVGR
ncbi:MAG: hypothetical protein KDE27_05130 [Planctomycetes bacterium]|nr:hypothetical protein [Planctomycetota bacterium]